MREAAGGFDQARAYNWCDGWAGLAHRHGEHCSYNIAAVRIDLFDRAYCLFDCIVLMWCMFDWLQVFSCMLVCLISRFIICLILVHRRVFDLLLVRLFQSHTFKELRGGSSL